MFNRTIRPNIFQLKIR